ncbi:MAG: ABC transporter substrate binding protein [Desulfosarcinaceae bacterium]|jgi:ABC-type uncharacterized transport system substrate-binding protein
MNRYVTFFSSALLALLIAASVASASKRVLYIDSYHKGFDWSDGITRAIKATLKDKDVDLRIFRMDTKRNPSEDFKKEAARKAVDLIKSFRPDVVIASDDNASKYIIVPYFKNADLPFVFCGVNNDAGKYGFPFRNVTGMVEVAPVAKLIYSLKHFKRVERVGYIASDTMTEHMDGESYSEEIDLKYIQRYPKTFNDWVADYKALQAQVDILIVGNNAGITDWDEPAAQRVIGTYTKIPTGCVYDWVIDHVFLGYTKDPEEHGEWAATAALKILDGASADSIPIVKSSKGNLIINTKIAKTLGIKVPRSYEKIAMRVLK